MFPVRDQRFCDRYRQLVKEHAHSAQPLAAGLSALPRVGKSFSSTQAAWRFFSNETVTLPALCEPLLCVGREGVAASACPYVLVVHDWSKLGYRHAAKTDLMELPGRENRGYDLRIDLLVDAADGIPLAPMDLQLQTA